MLIKINIYYQEFNFSQYNEFNGRGLYQVIYHQLFKKFVELKVKNRFISFEAILNESMKATTTMYSYVYAVFWDTCLFHCFDISYNQ